MKLIKKCARKYCQEINPQPITNFSDNNKTWDKLNCACNSCIKRDIETFVPPKPKKASMSLAEKNIRAFHKKAVRVPKWVNQEEIFLIYRNKPKDFNIDHIIPLNGKIVSGLHVPWNLQALSERDNFLKKNQFDGTYENESWRKKK